jgi:hypothetical protein
VTGYLGRLVARASGIAGAVVPRVPFRFEIGEQAASEQAASESGAPSLSLIARAPARAHPSGRRSFLTIQGPQAGPPAPRQSMPPARATELRPLAQTVFAQESSANPLPERQARVPARRQAAERTTAALPAVPSSARLPAVPAVPVLAARMASPALRRESGSDERPSQPDVVVVSIGRVDVRPSKPPSIPERAPERRPVDPKRLSLQDYLRGQREAR